ncbi:hypothetical protein D068_cds15550 [Bacillus atrophaeus UCMB-5137]|jgi:hypothetical protein|nr:hypothetical protein D068_cds15550 [Bacillus atrophaeus UCMB-5137]
MLREKAKGEEKPEEELMGKRKSSPRLATTSQKMLLHVVWTYSSRAIHKREEILAGLALIVSVIAL